jgi:hypothetical protein
MTTDYRLDFYNTSNALQAVLTGNATGDAAGEKSGFSGLAYTKQVNAPGFMIFSLRGDHELLSTLADKWQVEVWRKPDGQAWARDFVGIYRQPEWRYGDRSTFSGYCPGIISMLSWRHVMWKAGTASRSRFVAAKAETIMNTLVSYNACAAATIANGRIREGAIGGLTVEADGTDGNTIDWFCAYDNLLENLQKCAKVAGGDFDVVKTSSSAWQYRYYVGQLGTDRTASVKFSMNLGNMTDVQYRITRLDERTAVVVGGKGEGADRATATVTGTNYNVTTNNIENFLNATDVDTTDALTDRGDQYLDEVQAREVFTFTGREAPLSRYGVHYYLGDLVTAANPINGTDYTAKVMQAVVSFDDSGKEIINTLIETQ